MGVLTYDNLRAFVRLEDRVRLILVDKIGQDRIDYAELDSGAKGEADTTTSLPLLHFSV
jgi:hypothetical protein